MSKVECTREYEIMEAIAAGRWPDGCDDDLRAHIARCPGCFDLAEIAAAIRVESDAAVREAHVPSSGVVWWRVQRRAQQEAARLATRTITFVQIATLAGTAMLVLAILGGISLMRQDWGRLLSRGWFAATDLAASPAIAQWSTPIFLGIAMCVMLAPFAIYYAVTEE